MAKISVNIKNAGVLAGREAEEAIMPEIMAAKQHLLKGDAAGNDFLGWVDLPEAVDTAMLANLKADVARLSSKAKVMVVIGIGGSYLGARMVIEALQSEFASMQRGDKPYIVYAGHTLSEDYYAQLLSLLDHEDYAVTVISKSGTTTEPAVAFRIVKAHMVQKYGAVEAAKRIVAITDARRGALHDIAVQEGYPMYVIPDNVGGRFSVLTPVGLLPAAIAGFDINALVAGAVEIEKAPADMMVDYAATRNALYQAGKKIEILVNYNPNLHFLAEWWKQLYGESEGKDGKGIFPASVDFTTDLHSMGQWIQDGERTIFETVITVEKQRNEVVIPTDDADLDGLNYIAGKRVDEVNKMAELGTRLAHVDGGVPCMLITLPALTEKYLGQLIYFFEKACGMSGYMLGVNPFNQPGVEAYKKNMFALLNKPGYEAQSAELAKRL